MAVLSYQTIERYCQVPNPMIEPFHEDRLRAASYDLSVGEEYYLFREEHKEKVIIDKLKRNGSFLIPPNNVCYILTEEKVRIPYNVAGSLSLRLGLLKQGIMLAKQPQIDPGYEGKIVAMLYNLSNSAVKIARGEHLLSIEFRFLDEKTVHPYQEHYQRLEHLEDFIELPITSSIQSSLQSLRNDIEKWENKLSSAIPTILTIITVIIAVLVVLFSWLGIKSFIWSPKPENRPIEMYENMGSKEVGVQEPDEEARDSTVVRDRDLMP